jgi:hypothetical protein
MSKNTVPSGDHSKLKVTRGFICEYTNSAMGMELHFEFNPSSITRTRTIEFRTNNDQSNSSARDFQSERETLRVTQGATVKAESFTLKILLDATDRMNAGDKDATEKGIQPELDILYYMVEPKLQTPDGATTLAALGEGGSASQEKPFPSLLQFHWGEQILPVLMTQMQFTVKAYLPNLVPYRAEATLTLQIIQSENKIYTEEMRRVFNSAKTGSGPLQGYRDSHCKKDENAV